MHTRVDDQPSALGVVAPANAWTRPSMAARLAPGRQQPADGRA